MCFPPYIKKGSTIGVIAPSFGCTEEPYLSRFNEALKAFKNRGYNIKVGSCVHKNDGLGISTNPKVAANELMDFFEDSSVDAIISAGGGELMCEVMSYVNFNRLAVLPPKWFMGYSDNTNFIYPYITLCNTAAIYGPCFTGFGKPWERPELDAIAILEGKTDTVYGYDLYQKPEAGTESKENNPLSKYILTEKKLLKIFYKGTNCKELSFSGILLGGCLDVLENLVGTPYDSLYCRQGLEAFGGIIWFLEACDLSPLDIRRTLWHLREAGWFRNAKGFIIGRPLAAFNKDIMGVNQYNAVTDILGDLGLPIIMDADIGHIAPTMPVIVGSKCTVSVRENNISLEMKPME